MKSIDLVNAEVLQKNTHYLKSVRIRCFSGPYFPVFGLNTERYRVSLHIQSEYGKIRTRKTPNTDTFNAADEMINFDLVLSLKFLLIYY